jgi:hypothetical protein
MRFDMRRPMNITRTKYIPITTRSSVPSAGVGKPVIET